MIANWEVVVRLALATLLGCVIGLERERMERGAGLRTHALVCVGAALCMLVSQFGFEDLLRQSPAHVDLDPSRVAAQVVSGVGFLCAGTIILRSDIVRGLTTAASIWTVAGVGLAVGGGLYVPAVIGAAFCLFILAGLRPVEDRIFADRLRHLIVVIADRDPTLLSSVIAAVQNAGLHIHHTVVEPGKTDGEDFIELQLNLATSEQLISLVDTVRKIPGIKRIETQGH